MLTLENIKSPALLLEKDGLISLRTGRLVSVDHLDDLAALQTAHNHDLAFVVPFCSARENGMEVLGDEKILALLVNEEISVSRSEIELITAGNDILFTQDFEPTMSDEAFAAEVRKIQTEEIAAGNACQVIYSRKFESVLSDHSPLTPLEPLWTSVETTGAISDLPVFRWSRSLLCGCLPGTTA